MATMPMQGSEQGVLDPCSPPDLRHLRRLSDGFGIFQHTAREKPRLDFGYALDDVARALIVVTETARLFPSSPSSQLPAPSLAELADIYLRFIEYCQRPDGRFHNFVAHDRTFRDDEGSLDSYGRTVWALGVAARNAQLGTLNPKQGTRAAAALRRASPHFRDLSPLRSKAFTLLGLLAVLTDDDPFAVRGHAVHLVTDLLHAYEDAAADDWPWFEDALRYSNGVLPYALLAAASNSQLATRNSELVGRARAVGLTSLDFLLRELPVDGVPAPVGNMGWYPKGGTRALYDQQGVDAAAMVVASAEAFRVAAEVRYREASLAWWGWFFGNNTRGIPLYRQGDGAVLDGLMPEGVNEDRGAESIVAFLIAHLKLAEAFCEQRASG